MPACCVLQLVAEDMALVAPGQLLDIQEATEQVQQASQERPADGQVQQAAVQAPKRAGMSQSAEQTLHMYQVMGLQLDAIAAGEARCLYSCLHSVSGSCQCTEPSLPSPHRLNVAVAEANSMLLPLPLVRCSARHQDIDCARPPDHCCWGGCILQLAAPGCRPAGATWQRHLAVTC